MDYKFQNMANLNSRVCKTLTIFLRFYNKVNGLNLTLNAPAKKKKNVCGSCITS